MTKHMTQVPILINQDKDGGHTKKSQSMIENERPTTWWKTSMNAVFPRSMHEPIKRDMLWYDFRDHFPKSKSKTINFDGDSDDFPREPSNGLPTRKH